MKATGLAGSKELHTLRTLNTISEEFDSDGNDTA